jgi:UDPglucose 6-dehydrogenase
MKIAMIGTGYVGLVSGVCFSEFGFDVTCVDNNAKKIESLKEGIIPIYEPGLDALVNKNHAAGNLHFTTDLKEAVSQADVVFIAVGTPSRRGDGHADLSYVYAAAEEIAHALNGYTVVVTKSTVPVGTGRNILKILDEHAANAEYDVASNPEFLREGSAIEDFMRPDRVVVGTESERAKELMYTLYRPLYLNETPVVFTGLETAELIKYAANSFLALKVGFINEMADLAENVGANIQEVARGIGLDKRIGGKFLHPGPGYGGSCFPKDTLALTKIAEDAGTRATLVETVVEMNDKRKLRMADKIMQAMNSDINGKTITVLGLTFKPNTDDMRDSPSVSILPKLLEAGASIKTYDPQGMREAKEMLSGNITWCNDAYEAMENADALVILTEWNEFRSLKLDKVKSLLNQPVVIDLRNIYKRNEMEQAGFNYTSIGRPPVVQ